MIQTTRPEEGAPSLSSAPVHLVPGANSERSFRGWILLWSSFGFALLQSICTAFVAISGLRLGDRPLLAGFAAAALAFRGGSTSIWIRIPMVLLALAGALINLYAIWRIRRLRQRPASQWRMQARIPAKAPFRKSSGTSLPWRPSSCSLSRKPLHIILHHVL